MSKNLVGTVVVVRGRVTASVEGADLFGQSLTIVSADGSYIKTSDGSTWGTLENGGWNYSVRGSKTVYQDGLTICARTAAAIWNQA